MPLPLVEMTEEQIKVVQMQVDAVAEPVTILALFLLYVRRKDVE